MQGDDLDRKAKLVRLIAKLRADCIYLGHPSHLVNKWGVERLMHERNRALKQLMEAAPTRQGEAAW